MATGAGAVASFSADAVAFALDLGAKKLDMLRMPAEAGVVAFGVPFGGAIGAGIAMLRCGQLRFQVAASN